MPSTYGLQNNLHVNKYEYRPYMKEGGNGTIFILATLRIRCHAITNDYYSNMDYSKNVEYDDDVWQNLHSSFNNYCWDQYRILFMEIQCQLVKVIWKIAGIKPIHEKYEVCSLPSVFTNLLQQTKLGN